MAVQLRETSHKFMDENQILMHSFRYAFLQERSRGKVIENNELYRGLVIGRSFCVISNAFSSRVALPFLADRRLKALDPALGQTNKKGCKDLFRDQANER